MINAITDVVRKNGESYLTEEHVTKISGCYHHSTEIPGYSKLVSNEELAEKGYNLNISLYAYESRFSINESLSFSDAINEWRDVHGQAIEYLTDLTKMIS